MLTPSERDAFMNKLNNPESESAKELVRTATLLVKGEEPWWEVGDGDSDGDDYGDKGGEDDDDDGEKRRRLPVMIQIHQRIIKPPNLNGPPLVFNICAIGYVLSSSIYIHSPNKQNFAVSLTRIQLGPFSYHHSHLPHH